MIAIENKVKFVIEFKEGTGRTNNLTGRERGPELCDLLRTISPAITIKDGFPRYLDDVGSSIYSQWVIYGSMDLQTYVDQFAGRVEPVERTLQSGQKVTDYRDLQPPLLPFPGYEGLIQRFSLEKMIVKR